MTTFTGEKTLKRLRTEHEKQINTVLETNKDVTNVIFVGHHPITGCKRKLLGTKISRPKLP